MPQSSAITSESHVDGSNDDSLVESCSALCQTLPFDDSEILPASIFEPPIRIMALHAMLYCERLFYLEEVEEIYVADGNVYAGRRLHDDVVPEDDVTPEKRSFQVSSETWGLSTVSVGSRQLAVVR